MLAGFVRFVGILFLIVEKGDKQKIGPGILRYVSMPFLKYLKTG